MKSTKNMHCVMSIGRRVRACTRLSKAAKALATRDHVRGISGLSAPSNNKCPFGEELFRKQLTLHGNWKPRVIE
jgi:hypothetical protein